MALINVNKLKSTHYELLSAELPLRHAVHAVQHGDVKKS